MLFLAVNKWRLLFDGSCTYATVACTRIIVLSFASVMDANVVMM